MYDNISNFGEGVDNAFVFIFTIILIFFVGITITLIYFIYKYKFNENRKALQIHGSVKLEIIWTVIPIILVLGMFYYGWKGWAPMFRSAPDDAMEIETISRMWSWNFTYENGRSTDTLYVPLEKPVKLNLKSMDVIHSLYIPAFRMKQDIVPGRDDVSMWFIPQKTGTYDLYCTEYCGLRHSYMYTAVVVMEPDQFEKWYEDTTMQQMQAAASPAQAGLQIMRQLGCIACHSLDGSRLVGPTYKGLWGKEETVITNGEERNIVVDEEYIIRSIYEPNADVVEGFNPGLMQSYENQITEEEMDKIIEYFKSLSQEGS